MCVSLYLPAKLEYLQRGFELGLILTSELPEHFMYSSYIYEMIHRSRQQSISTFVGNRENMRFVNL
jgi:hypothetical protein